MKIPLALLILTWSSMWSWTAEQQRWGDVKYSPHTSPACLEFLLQVPKANAWWHMSETTPTHCSGWNFTSRFLCSGEESCTGGLFFFFLTYCATSPLMIRIILISSTSTFQCKLTSLWWLIHLETTVQTFWNKLCKIIAAVNNPRRVLGERRGENFHEVRGGENTQMLKEKTNVEPTSLLSRTLWQSYTTSGAFHTHYQHHNSVYWAYEDEWIQLHTQQITCFVWLEPYASALIIYLK